MPQRDLAIPILPSRSVQKTIEFYRELGFDGKIWGAPYFYAILTRGDVEVHFFTHAELVPEESAAGCYIRVQDVDEIFALYEKIDLPHSGIPRIDRVEDKPWGMREFAIVDPDGNLIRIGQAI